jgi:hypothetical protein
VSRYRPLLRSQQTNRPRQELPHDRKEGHEEQRLPSEDQGRPGELQGALRPSSFLTMEADERVWAGTGRGGWGALYGSPRDEVAFDAGVYVLLSAVSLGEPRREVYRGWWRRGSGFSRLFSSVHFVLRFHPPGLCKAVLSRSVLFCIAREKLARLLLLVLELTFSPSLSSLPPPLHFTSPSSQQNVR